MAKKKQKTIYKLSEDAASLLQLKVRLKAADSHGMVVCVTCDKKIHYADADGSHYISRKWTATKLLEENIHCCCRYCNRFQYGALDRYTLFMIDFYGREFVDELQVMKHQPKKYGREEILNIITELKTDVKELKKRFE